MKIITKYPLYINGKKASPVSYYANAAGSDSDAAISAQEADFKQQQKDEKAAGIKYFSEQRRDERKTERKDIRAQDGGFFKHLLKEIKRDARKLFHKKDKKGADVYADTIPHVNAAPDGTPTKTLDDGSKVTVPQGDVVAVNTATGLVTPATAADVKNPAVITVDNKDLVGKPPVISTNPVTNAPVVETHHTEQDVVHTDNGDTYKKTDLAKEGDKTKGGMSKNLKMGLIIGGAVLALGIGVLVYKHYHKK